MSEMSDKPEMYQGRPATISQSISEQFDQDSEQPFNSHRDQDLVEPCTIQSETEEIVSLEPKKMEHFTSEVSPDSSLYNMLDTGRFHKRFVDITKIGQGGFGEVYKALY